MKSILLLALLFAVMPSHPSVAQQHRETPYDKYPVYKGTDLGLTFPGVRAHLRVWAPTASGVTVRVYKDGTGGAALLTAPMTKAEGGTWTHFFAPGTTGFYTVQATIDGKAMKEVADPYAHAVGINGQRGAILDVDKVSPDGWDNDRRPPLASASDIVIGELHVRDLSMSATSGIQHKGKYLGLTETGTHGPENIATGLDHLTELGITHLHLLPTNDYASIDEARTGNSYNWGYDPLHYSVPEGTYATDAANPEARIREFKQMVQALHGQGLRVVLDVVYNHTALAGNTSFEQLAPGYYYRFNKDGSWSNASGCGNEIASERPMVRKMIVESVAWWASRYRVDGFRFDLMGALDLETMRQVRRALDQIDPSIFVYGEGWTAGGSPLPDSLRAIKQNTHHLKGIAAFSDELRDGVKGHYARHEEPGFASGKAGQEESVRFGIVGAIRHPQVDNRKVNYSHIPWANEPTQCINYVACHDDMLLWDKLKESVPSSTEEERIRMDALANTIVFTSQGVPFLPVGDEFLRTKQGSHNSYNLPDSINQIDWTRKVRYRAVYDYYRKLIALRHNHGAFRLGTADKVRAQLSFLPGQPEGAIAYRITGLDGADGWKSVTVVFNGNRHAAAVTVPQGRYKVILKGMQIDEGGAETLSHAGGSLDVAATSALILVE